VAVGLVLVDPPGAPRSRLASPDYDAFP
jgi:hypothetical protein